MSVQDELVPIPKDWPSHTVSTLLKLMSCSAGTVTDARHLGGGAASWSSTSDQAFQLYELLEAVGAGLLAHLLL